MASGDAPPGTIQCQYCFKFAKLGMVCEFCSQPLPPPPRVASVAPPPMGMPMGGPMGASVPGYASRGQWGFDSGMTTMEAALRRWAARAVDTFLLLAIAVGVILVTGQANQLSRSSGTMDVLANVAILLIIAIWVTYSVVLTALNGQTLGKMLLGIRVVGPDGGPPGWGRALLRELVGRGVEEGICALGTLGLFWMLWDAEQQTWHDKIGGTHVERV
jgi:uncharacterized RDD family membrane protein YckC